jgi:hypothetical protein
MLVLYQFGSWRKTVKIVEILGLWFEETIIVHQKIAFYVMSNHEK